MKGFKQEDISFAEGNKKLGNAFVSVVLSIQKDNCDQELNENLTVKNAVMYESGIFRIQSIWDDKDDSNKKLVRIHGYFSEKDPNGVVSNGWTEDELEDEEAIEVGTIDSLEV